jgi:hypothetical protein
VVLREGWPALSVRIKITLRDAKSSPETRFEAVISLIQEIGFSAEKNLLNFCFFYLNYQSTWNIKVLRLVTGPLIRRRISGDEDHRKIDPEGFIGIPGLVCRDGFAGSRRSIGR